jgi:hypothetical protein
MPAWPTLENNPSQIIAALKQIDRALRAWFLNTIKKLLEIIFCLLRF